ncbi:MAG: hypothetical protein RIR79_1373 [Pseudomonadota bacterium]|jgi:uncharacterized membrane protein YedE/YeeE
MINISRVNAVNLLVTLISGALFGFGLAFSTMVQPAVIFGFFQGMDYGLLLVMVGAIAVVFPVYRWFPRYVQHSGLGEGFQTHPAVWNRDTLIGSALFGMGWGLSGVCPGPALASVGTGNGNILWALLGIALGALLHGLKSK